LYENNAMTEAAKQPQNASSSALNPGVAKREVFGWTMYDFANSGYTTVVLTAVFNAYFVGVVAGKAEWATLAWTGALALSCLLVVLTAPAIGALADARRSKKSFLLMVTVGCVASTAALAWVGPGQVALAVVLIVVSNYCFAIGETLNSAFLPELARQEAMGKVSGWGWSFGYFGGMVALGLSLAYVLHAQKNGMPAAQFVPVTMLITATIFALAVIPTFAWLKERGAPGSQRDPQASVGDSFRRLQHTWRESANYRDFRIILASGVFYQAGISVVIALAAVYAEQAMKFTSSQTMMLVFLVNIASAIGAFAFGYFQDRLGHKRALSITLVAWMLMTVLAYVATEPLLFWIAAVIAGLCMGSSQSVGRAMVGILSPPDRLGEFYGLWALATRVAAIIGPITYGLVTWMTNNNHRLAILSTGVFFVIGWVILRGMSDLKSRPQDYRAS
jgi:MFS transporter, UMF1 family